MIEVFSALLELKNLSKFAAILACLGWSISCYYWILSAQVKAESSLPPPDENQKTGTVMTKGGFYVDGVPQMTTGDIKLFLNEAGRLNKIAAIISSVSAVLTALSVFLS
ncbi:hypothetical protein JAU75_19495 [Ochrobactrum sp. Q0168]|uniref:hypothetical protein n=1 Tax=Ochrobactrum sp. Q0168 TaxID=2793241 RepID=UPI0018EB06BB|nr:hypothetical protein [Ochrobactrum sp. Q0168]